MSLIFKNFPLAQKQSLLRKEACIKAWDYDIAVSLEKMTAKRNYDDEDDELFLWHIDQQNASRTIVRDSHHHKSPTCLKQDFMNEIVEK